MGVGFSSVADGHTAMRHSTCYCLQSGGVVGHHAQVVDEQPALAHVFFGQLYQLFTFSHTRKLFHGGGTDASMSDNRSVVREVLVERGVGFRRYSTTSTTTKHLIRRVHQHLTRPRTVGMTDDTLLFHRF